MILIGYNNKKKSDIADLCYAHVYGPIALSYVRIVLHKTGRKLDRRTREMAFYERNWSLLRSISEPYMIVELNQQL
jgi:hypothetical protein